MFVCDGAGVVNKEEFRAEVRSRLRELSSPERAASSGAICATISALPRWQDAKVVFLYSALSTEPSLNDLWLPQIRRDKRFFLPRLSELGMEIRFHSADDPYLLQRNTANFFEPPQSSLGHDPSEPPDIVLVPGLAFSPSGVRLGRGRGHYDRALTKFPNAMRIGVAFNCQIFDMLPEEPHDQKVHALVTEQGAFSCVDA